MSELIQKMNEMIKNNQIPENIKNIISKINSDSSSNQTIFNNSEKKIEALLSSEASNDTQNSNSTNLNSSSEEAKKSSESNTAFSSFDIGTILKIKSFMDNINQDSDDSRSNLLKSLKPYLRSSRKEKVDQYVQIFRMGKIFEVMNSLGGENKNDV